MERLPGKDQREEREIFLMVVGGRGIRNLESKNPEKVQQSFSRLSQIANPVLEREREYGSMVLVHSHEHYSIATPSFSHQFILEGSILLW